MIIMLIGNMASGKSTTAKELAQQLKGFKHLELDEFRKKYNKEKTLEGDNKAQLELIKAIKANKNVIVESTGTGKWYQEYFRMDKHDHAKIILIDSDPKLCLKRHQSRLAQGYELPPIPSSWSLEFKTSLDWMHDKLKFACEDFKVSAKDSVQSNVKKITKFLSL